MNEDLTIRDYFAAVALQGILQHGGKHGHIDGKGDEEKNSKMAYCYADAMIKQRNAEYLGKVE